LYRPWLLQQRSEGDDGGRPEEEEMEKEECKERRGRGSHLARSYCLCSVQGLGCMV